MRETTAPSLAGTHTIPVLSTRRARVSAPVWVSSSDASGAAPPTSNGFAAEPHTPPPQLLSQPPHGLSTPSSVRPSQS